MLKKTYIATFFSVISSSLFAMNTGVPVHAHGAVTQNIIKSGLFKGLTEQQAIEILSQEMKEKRDAEKAAGQAAATSSTQQQQQQGQNPPFGVQLNFN